MSTARLKQTLMRAISFLDAEEQEPLLAQIQQSRSLNQLVECTTSIESKLANKINERLSNFTADDGRYLQDRDIALIEHTIARIDEIFMEDMDIDNIINEISDSNLQTAGVWRLWNKIIFEVSPAKTESPQNVAAIEASSDQILERLKKFALLNLLKLSTTEEGRSLIHQLNNESPHLAETMIISAQTNTQIVTEKSKGIATAPADIKDSKAGFMTAEGVSGPAIASRIALKAHLYNGSNKTLVVLPQQWRYGITGDMAQQAPCYCPEIIVFAHELIHVLHNRTGKNLRNLQPEQFKQLSTDLRKNFINAEEWHTTTGSLAHLYNDNLSEVSLAEAYGSRPRIMYQYKNFPELAHQHSLGNMRHN